MALGVHFGGQGRTPERFQRAVASKGGGAKLASHHFNRFWRPKGVQKAIKMKLKSSKF